MDHRWDDRIRQERAARAERDRYGASRVARDESVERRDRLAMHERPVNFSPWAIGAAHYDQRDLYTRDARVSDAGYARGPSVHPDVGSYAYPREEPVGAPERRAARGTDGPSLYEREAWPWLNYHDAPPTRHTEPFWSRMKHTVQRVMGRSHAGRGPKNWRSDLRIHDDVCEALAMHGELDATDIEVEVEAAEVTLRGTVPDRASKRLAERIVERCHGVADVHNRLAIRRHDDTNDADVAFVMPAMPSRALG